LLNRLEVDRAVFFAVASRVWQLAAGPVTIILIANYFSPEVQGYYYTFWSLIGLQMFFDLSFHQVVVNVTSHEWEKLSLGPDRSVIGDAAALSRLSSLLRSAAVWYGVAALLFGITVSVAGLIFFSAGASSQQLSWQLPWLALVALTALAFWMTPLISLLEGCNQVANVYRTQFVRAVAGNLIVWAGIPLGAGLWTAALATVVRLACEGFLVGVHYRRLFAELLQRPDGPTLNWWEEVWPFQWRMGLKGLFGYFNTYLINPIVFFYQGEIAAGQMGMTWQVLTALQAACLSWIKARVARFGMLVARADYHELDRIFFRLTSIAAATFLLAAAGFWSLTWGLYLAESRFAPRLLEPWPTALLGVALLLALVSDCQWTYIHAHKRSPYMLLTVAISIGNGLLIWWGGSRYGALGVATAYLTTNVLFNAPIWTWVWFRLRSEWHGLHAERRGQARLQAETLEPRSEA